MSHRPESQRTFNFSSGPAMLPLPVLERAREEMLSFAGTGMSVMELSHRSDHFDTVLTGAEASMRRLLRVPDEYSVLFLQGGATAQFGLIPMNFLPEAGFAQYVITGYWGKKAIAAAKRQGAALVAYSGEAEGFSTVPTPDRISIDPNAAYIHYTSNETIDGVEFRYDLDGGGVPVICDACSNILSKPIDIGKYAMIYAGAQKNIGPSGVTVAIIRRDLLERVPDGLHPVFDYGALAENRSMVNTPNTWGIYLVGLVCDWIEEQGGLVEMRARSENRAQMIYNAIDASDGFFRGRARREARSNMNVTFTLPTEELNIRFCEEAKGHGMDGLAGHRSVGGIRASVYNAFPMEGVETLLDFMKEFAERNG